MQFFILLFAKYFIEVINSLKKVYCCLRVTEDKS